MTHACRLGEDEMEVGLGLHGEPGAATHKMQCANDIAAQVGPALLQSMQHMTPSSYTHIYTQCIAAQLFMHSMSLLLNVCE